MAEWKRRHTTLKSWNMTIPIFNNLWKGHPMGNHGVFQTWNGLKNRPTMAHYDIPQISWREKLQLSPVGFSLGARKFMSGVHFPSNKNHWPRYLHFVNPPSGLESVEPLNYPWFLSGLSHIFPGVFFYYSHFAFPTPQTPNASSKAAAETDLEDELLGLGARPNRLLGTATSAWMKRRHQPWWVVRVSLPYLYSLFWRRIGSWFYT